MTPVLRKLLQFTPLIIFLLVCSGLCFSQTREEERQLRELDSIAFTALENSLPDVEQKALELLKKSQQLPPTFFEVNANTLLGIINKNRGYYVTALTHYLQALNTAEKLGDQGRISACLNNIGSVYHLQKNHEQALSYFNQSLEIENQLNQPLQKSIRYYNIGDVYKDMDSLDLSLTFFTNSLLIEKKKQNQEGIIYANLGIADIYLKSERLNDAAMVLDETEAEFEDYQIEEKVIWLRLKGALEQLRNASSSIQFFIQAEELSKKHKLRSLLPQLLKDQIEYYENSGEWKVATEKYKEYTKLNEELNSTLVKNQLADLTFQNELNKKEMEIQLVQEERDLAKQRAENESKIRRYESRIVWLLLSTIFVILIFVFFIRKVMINRQ